MATDTPSTSAVSPGTPPTCTRATTPATSRWLPGQAACVVILSNDEAADTEALLRQLVPVALADDEP
jgi:hypothetical protein